MEKSDIGVKIYENNEVSEHYKSKVRINDLSMLNTPANVRKFKKIMKDETYVDILPDGKVIWKGPKHKFGYALINVRKLLPDVPDTYEGGTYVLGHRLVYELLNGGASTNALICHRSDVPSNLDPKDLFPGTHAQNSKCIKIHDRRIYPKGQDHWNSKLDDKEVVKIVHLYYNSEMTIKDIAINSGVSSNTVSNLLNGRGPWAELANRAKDAALAARS